VVFIVEEAFSSNRRGDHAWFIGRWASSRSTERKGHVYKKRSSLQLLRPTSQDSRDKEKKGNGKNSGATALKTSRRKLFGTQCGVEQKPTSKRTPIQKDQSTETASVRDRQEGRPKRKSAIRICAESEIPKAKGLH